MVPAALDVDALLGRIEILLEGGRNPAEVFVAAGVNRVTDEDPFAAARSALQDRRDAMEIWQLWSYDRRWTLSPYLDDLQVGHYDAGRHHVRRHTTAVDAYADFVLAEMR